MEKDLQDGYLLIQLLEIISAKDLPKHKKHPKIRAQQLENAAAAIKFIKDEGIKVRRKAARGRASPFPRLLSLVLLSTPV